MQESEGKGGRALLLSYGTVRMRSVCDLLALFQACPTLLQWDPTMLVLLSVEHGGTGRAGLLSSIQTWVRRIMAHTVLPCPPQDSQGKSL